jgi:hypothetical protein
MTYKDFLLPLLPPHCYNYHFHQKCSSWTFIDNKRGCKIMMNDKRRTIVKYRLEDYTCIDV